MHSKTEACAKCLRKHTSEILARNTCWYEAHIEELSQKVGALEAKLAAANEGGEEYERKYYLETDKVEDLRAKLAIATEALRKVLQFSGSPLYVECIVNSALSWEQKEDEK